MRGWSVIARCIPFLSGGFQWIYVYFPLAWWGIPQQTFLNEYCWGHLGFYPSPIMVVDFKFYIVLVWLSPFPPGFVITFFVGDPCKPSFAAITGKGDNSSFSILSLSIHEDTWFAGWKVNTALFWNSAPPLDSLVILLAPCEAPPTSRPTTGAPNPVVWMDIVVLWLQKDLWLGDYTNLASEASRNLQCWAGGR